LLNNSEFNDYERFSEYGRFATIRFKNEKDAIKIYLDKIKINLPLINHKKGTPMMYPGNLLKTYLENN
jgi:hypothetical protein